VPKIDILMPGSSVNSDQGIIGFCAVILIEGTRRVLFDSAHVGRRTLLLEQLRRRGLTPKDIDVQVLSHAHWDHVQNVDVFGHAPLLLHPLERAYARNPHPNDWATPQWTGAVLELYKLEEVGEGYEIMPGCRVIELPGHSPGSIGLEVMTDQGRCVLTGDAIHNANVALMGASPLVFWDVEQADASIRRCLEMDAIIYPGHDRPFRIDDGRVQYCDEFHFGISGVTADTPGLEFIGVGPSYITGGPEGWAKGGGKRWVMPGIEEQHSRIQPLGR
jgi:N-acyl homoserine lactone hydrolase